MQNFSKLESKPPLKSVNPELSPTKKAVFGLSFFENHCFDPFRPHEDHKVLFLVGKLRISSSSWYKDVFSSARASWNTALCALFTIYCYNRKSNELCKCPFQNRRIIWEIFRIKTRKQTRIFTKTDLQNNWGWGDANMRKILK